MSYNIYQINQLESKINHLENELSKIECEYKIFKSNNICDYCDSKPDCNICYNYDNFHGKSFYINNKEIKK